MKNNLLKRKLNPFLLVTTVLVLAILAGASVIYQQELGELVGTRDNLSTEIQETESELEQARENISELRETRDSLQDDKEGLETDLSDLRDSTDEEISGLETDLEEARSERDDYRERFQEENETRHNLEQENNDLVISLELVCSDLNKSKSSYSECESYGYE